MVLIVSEGGRPLMIASYDWIDPSLVGLSGIFTLFGHQRDQAGDDGPVSTTPGST